MTSNTFQTSPGDSQCHRTVTIGRAQRSESGWTGLCPWRRPRGRSFITTRPGGGLERQRECIAWRPLRPGELLPGCAFQVVGPLSVGGMGEIYEVRDGRGTTAAMKVLSSNLQGRANLVGRMVDEGRALQLIDHPNVVSWRDAGVLDGGRPYVVTELLRGRTLRAHLRWCGAVSPPRARRWVVALLLALDAVHQTELVHCDVKLDNVFLCLNGSIKLLDLGAAERASDHRAATSLPPIGTPRYMAPEQLAGRGVDARTDVFAAGLMLAELLCGGWPPENGPGSNTGPQVGQLCPQVAAQAPDLLAVISRATATEPEARYPNALAMARKVLNPLRRSVRPATGSRTCRTAAERLLVSDQ